MHSIVRRTRLSIYSDNTNLLKLISHATTNMYGIIYLGLTVPNLDGRTIAIPIKIKTAINSTHKTMILNLRIIFCLTNFTRVIANFHQLIIDN